MSSLTEFPPSPPPIKRRHKKEVPLTFSQESMWFLQQLDPFNTAYNSNHVVKFSGELDPIAMEKALNELVLRHEPLRTIYPNIGGRPIQIAQPFKPFSLPLISFSHLSEDDRNIEAKKLIIKKCEEPYNLQQGPLVRFSLLHLFENQYELFFSMHHIGSDAWSWQILRSELMRLYSSFKTGKNPDLKDLPIQFNDYALWQREWLDGGILSTYTNHWKNLLSGDLPILDFPTDHPRPDIQTFRGRRYRFVFSPSLESKIKAFCMRERITPFHFYLAVYSVLLMKYSNQEDIIIGCPFANRHTPDLDGLAGLFVNTLPIRVNLTGNPSIRTFLSQVRETMLDAFAWQAAPFDALVSKITPERDLSRTPIFQVAINMRNVSRINEVEIKGLKYEDYLHQDAPAPFDLSLEFDNVEESFIASFQYNTDLFDEMTIIHLVAHYQNLLSEMIEKSEQTISELKMLTLTERKRILFDWNETKVDYPQVCVHELVTAQAKRTPDATAIVCNETSISFGDLETKANQFASFLRKKGVTTGSLVGMYLPRSEYSIISILAILKAGGAYVPLDITYPSERVAFMVEDSKPVCVITLSTLESRLPEQIQKVYLDVDESLIWSGEEEEFESCTKIDSPIYVMYTSGSTGRPKGVVNIHKGIANYLIHMRKHFLINPSDSIIQLTSLSFDVSVFEIFSALINGGRLYVMDDIQMRDPGYINKVITEHRVTILSMVPTMLRSLCESAIQQDQNKNNLRLIFPAGEALLKSDVELAYRAYGESVQLVNQYGPTECSIIHTTYSIPSPFVSNLEKIPIGRPINNARAYILDRFLNPVPVGVRGELFIGGRGVGKGYINQPKLTDERFIPDPFFPGEWMYQTGDMVRYLPEGIISYLGRFDNQVKIRGYRVEPGEIEAVIAEFPGVKQAVVKLWHIENRETLIAYVTGIRGNEEDFIDRLRKYLSDRLPFYMIPASIMILEVFPQTPNGKCDQNALPFPDRQKIHDQYVPPRNEIENRLIAIWKNVLNVETIGVRDNFFELGGHSLLAVQLFSHIQDEFGQSIPLLVLFKESTIEALALYLNNNKKSITAAGIAPIKYGGSCTPLFLINPGAAMKKLASEMESSRTYYGLYPYKEGQLVIRGPIKETSKIYYQYLLNFEPQSSYNILGYSMDGLCALELARLLRNDGKSVTFLGLLDTHPPKPSWLVYQSSRIKFHLRKLQNRRFDEVILYIFGTARRVIKQRVNNWTGKQKKIIRENDRKAKEIKNLPLRTYRPEPYDGQVILFKASSRFEYAYGDPMDEWSKIAIGPLKIVTIEGTHTSLLELPQVNDLAKKINSFLDKNEL